MPILIAGLLVFIGTHVFTMVRGQRAALIGRLGGEGRYKAAYSIVSAIGLVLVVYGYGQYRAHDWVDVWYPPVWTKHLALTLVMLAFVCLAAAYIPGRIQRVLKHPMLLAVKIWATAHLLANGDLGSMLMFGSLLAWAVLARISIKRRGNEITAHGGPVVAQGGWGNDVGAVVVGVGAWFVFARFLHPLLIGVYVWPGT